MRRQLVLVACAVFLGGLVHGIAQDLTHKPISVVEDWSSHHVVFTEDVPRELWPTVLADSRFWQQYYRRHMDRWRCRPQEADGGESRCHRDPCDGSNNDKCASDQRDWSFSLGGGDGGATSGPADFSYDVTSPPNCTTDYVATGISAAGSSTQANIIGLNNLYVNTAGTGTCSGTAPTVMFAYNIGPGVVQSSPTVSLDGTKLAFMENNTSAGTSTFHVLTFKTGTGNGTSATAPAVPGTGNTATNRTVSFSTTSTTSQFVDYDDDVAYITTNGSASVVHKVTPVFGTGTPTEVMGGGWPATITGNPGISTPVFDFTTKHVFVTTGNGFIYYVDDSVSPATVTGLSCAGGNTANTAGPPLVDSTRKLVYAFFSSNGTNALVAQATTSLTGLVTATVGKNETAAARAGDFNNSYYTGSGGASAARLYVVGNDSSTAQVPALFSITFTGTGYTMTSGAATNGPLALSTTTTAGVGASPLTEFYNSTTSTDYLFVGITNACSTAVTGGCIRSLNISSAFPTTSNVNSVILAASGGTGRITVDNNSSNTGTSGSTGSGTSNVYFTPLSGSPGTIVKATQSGLF